MADVLSPNSTEAKLALFLREIAGRVVVYGTLDCCIWLADWLMLWRGVEDPAAEWRGRYHDHASAEDLLGSTPYPVLIGRLARRAGLCATRTPNVGAVAMVVLSDGVVAGAIRTTIGWALLHSPRGFVCVPHESIRVLAAWEPAQCLM